MFVWKPAPLTAARRASCDEGVYRYQTDRSMKTQNCGSPGSVDAVVVSTSSPKGKLEIAVALSKPSFEPYWAWAGLTDCPTPTSIASETTAPIAKSAVTPVRNRAPRGMRMFPLLESLDYTTLDLRPNPGPT
jgi:hypothetical protein